MDFNATNLVVSALLSIATVIVMVITLRRQARKDGEEAQRLLMGEVRRIAGDLERRHEASARDFRDAVRTLHERVDRKERDFRAGDDRLDSRLHALQENMRDISEIKGEVKAIRTQVTVIQHGLQEKQ